MIESKMELNTDEERKIRLAAKYDKVRQIVSATLEEMLRESGLGYYVSYRKYSFRLVFNLPHYGIVRIYVYYKDFAKMDLDGLISSVKALERITSSPDKRKA